MSAAALEAGIEELLDLTLGPGAEAVRPKWQTFTPEEFCRGHAKQLAFVTDRSPFIHVMCARQVGKSWGDDFILFDNAANVPNSINLLLGLTGPAVRISNWVPVWKREICDPRGVPQSWHNETHMITTFPNGARVMFAGTDDLRHVRNYLGNRLDRGVVILDESQSQGQAVMSYILDNLLPPMLTPTSRVILSGVLPDMPVGKFLDLAAYDEESKTGGKGPGWSHHSWARKDNVHTPEALKQLEDYCKKHNIPRNDPQILRDWDGRRVWSVTAGAYRYREAINGYDALPPPWLLEVYDKFSVEGASADAKHEYEFAHPIQNDPKDGARFGMMAAEPFPGIKYFGIALDPGAHDRAAIEAYGWGDQSRDIQHVFDWTTPRGAGLTTGKMYAVLGLVYRWLLKVANSRGGGVMTPRYDTTSHNSIDNLQRDFGIPLVMAAKKGELKDSVDRTNTMLDEGREKVMRGSPLEQDYQKARFDPDARARGLYRWESTWHPDPSESGRYAKEDFFNAYVEPVPAPPPGSLDEHREQVRQMLREARENEEREGDSTGGLWG